MLQAPAAVATPTDTREPILLVEDSPEQAALVRRWLEGRPNLQVWHCSDAESAERALGFRDWSLVICDVELPGMDGLELIRRSRAVNRWAPTLLVTAHENFSYARRAIQNKADDFLVKPLVREPFIDKVSALIRYGHEERRRHQNVVLAVGAHPDDVEIGCGGILLRHRAKGDKLVVLTLTGGDQGGVKSERVVESAKAAELLDAELIIGDLPDTKVSEGLDTIALIEDAIRRHQPNVIYTHTSNDQHQDHRAVHRATVVAARGIPNVYCYQSPSSTVDFRPTLFVEIGEHLAAKIQVIDAYRSQVATRQYLIPDLITATSRYWGRFSSFTPVEPLEVIRRTE
jgi:LmbE family N-acetylglucosaminyl deacetylase/CheY-like chemotaxis protein